MILDLKPRICSRGYNAVNWHLKKMHMDKETIYLHLYLSELIHLMIKYTLDPWVTINKMRLLANILL